MYMIHSHRRSNRSMHNFCEGLSPLIPTGTYNQPAQRSVNSSATMCGSVHDSLRQCGCAGVCSSAAESVCGSVCVAVYGNVWQCAVVSGSVLQCAAVCGRCARIFVFTLLG
jgi:hypothetical protein